MLDRRPHAVQRTRGFTLIEIMIALAIVAILAAVAIPSYQSQVRKSRRADAVSELSRIQQAQERFRGQATAYGAALTGANSLGYSTTATPGGYYTLSVASPATGATGAAMSGATTANSYSAIATASGSQTSDTSCAVLKVSMVGGNFTYFAGATASSLADAASNAAAKRCWNR